MSGAINRANKKTICPSKFEIVTTAVMLGIAAIATVKGLPDLAVTSTFLASNFILIMAGEFIANSR